MTASPHGSLRDVVAQADRQRRARIADRLLSRTAPWVALGLLVLAIVGRFAGWPRWIPLAALAVTAVVLGVFAVLQRRALPTSDATANAVDQDAGLRGELRSAHWFEAIAPETERNAWAAYHMDVAADRAAKVDWPALYPPVKAGRQWAGTALLSAAIIAMSVALPQRVATAPVDAASIDPALAAQLPPDLAKKLAALMAQLQAGEADAKTKQMSLEEMKALMAKLDPAMQKKLAEMLEKMSAAVRRTRPRRTRPMRGPSVRRTARRVCLKTFAGRRKTSRRRPRRAMKIGRPTPRTPRRRLRPAKKAWDPRRPSSRRQARRPNLPRRWCGKPRRIQAAR
jgi:hypothetical protein